VNREKDENREQNSRFWGSKSIKGKVKSKEKRDHAKTQRRKGSAKKEREKRKPWRSELPNAHLHKEKRRLTEETF
jgi:hypothetical protein